MSEESLVNLSRAPSASRFVLGGLMVAAAAAVLLFLVDWTQLRDALSAFRASPLLLVALIAAYTGAFWLRAVAWRALLTHKIGLFSLFAALQASLFANHILPFKLGEFARPMLARRRGLPLAQAATTTAIARTLDFSALIVIASMLGAALSLATGRGLWVQGLALLGSRRCRVCGDLVTAEMASYPGLAPRPFACYGRIAARPTRFGVAGASPARRGVDAAQLGAGGRRPARSRESTWHRAVDCSRRGRHRLHNPVPGVSTSRRVASECTRR